MLYLKIMDGETIVSAEAHEDPVYICRQQKNDILVRCPDVHAQGILSLDGETVYQLHGKTSFGDPSAYEAYPIYVEEYDEIMRSLPPEEDPEDEDPEIPDDPEAEILTRAELTALVRELQAQNEMLEECLLEMSEIVYE